MILVFKTSVQSIAEIDQLKPDLDALLTSTEKWNFDLEDCDRILRVESVVTSVDAVIELLSGRGVECAELADEIPA